MLTNNIINNAVLTETALLICCLIFLVFFELFGNWNKIINGVIIFMFFPILYNYLALLLLIDLNSINFFFVFLKKKLSRHSFLHSQG